jgi:hypothetical protein
MTFDVLADLKWPAIVVATIAYFALGAVWYSPPVFGKAWMRVSGIQTPESVLLVSGYFDQQKSEPLVWVAILSGYHLVGLTLAAAIVAIWN